MADHQHHREVLDELARQHRALRRMIPEVYEGFAALSGAALADGALSRKVKELVAMAIGIVRGCDGCIASRSRRGTRRCDRA
jgi:alkylhydroperoxidase/carboxymuconolactone decarboxylase family protein YurZ